MFNKASLILSISILFIFIHVSAQNSQVTQTIRGTVIDKASGVPLPYASIGILNIPQIGGYTDNNGNFELHRVPVGRCDLQVTLVGYESAIVREILVTSSKEISLEIQLKENVHELNEVVVTNQTEKNQPLNNMVLSGGRMFSVEEARRYAGGLDDPARLVSSFAGVSPSMGNNGISIHGNAPHLLQWKVEGVEVPNPNHFADIATLGGGILSSLSSNVLGNSDFYTGAFPAEYGNAVSGVFDMRLRNGNNQKHEHTFQAGILGLDFASEGPFSKKSNSSYIFNYRYSTTSLFDKLGGDMDGQVMDYQDLNFKLNFPTKSAGTFSVWGTALIDKFKNSPDKDMDKWESFEDRLLAESKQTSAAGGINHKYFFRNDASLKTSLAATFAKADLKSSRKDYSSNLTPDMDSESKYTNLVFQSAFNKKISSRLTNTTGISFTKMYYDTYFNLAPNEGAPLNKISDGDGNIDLSSFYTSFLVGLSNDLDMSLGVHTQEMSLNKKISVEPRVAVRWNASKKSSFALAYGLHSRMEKMDVYMVKSKVTGEYVNKDLGFTKAHHIVLTYDFKIGDDMHLKIEPYAQFLYNVPVIADSSYSVLNRKDFWIEDPMVDKGKGRNIGIDITFEKYLTRGLYYMITASVFNSKYCGGDGVWHNTRYNRDFIVNGLIGKEWEFGQNKQRTLGVNLKLTLQGGERYSPIDETATMANPDKEVQYDETKAFSKQFSPMFLTNFSINYKINKKKTSHEFSIQSANTTGYKEYYGHIYNIKKNEIEVDKEAVQLFNVSYKIQF